MRLITRCLELWILQTNSSVYFQDNEYETEISNSDDEIDIDGKLKLDDLHGDDDDDYGSDQEENDVTTFGQKRKKNILHGQPPTKKSKKAERKS